MRIHRKRIPAVVLPLVLWLAQIAPAAMAQTPLLSVVGPAMEDTVVVDDGSIFTLTVEISSEATELMGWDVAIVFDSDVIELLSVSEGSLPLTSGYSTFFYTYDTGAPVDSVRVNGAILGNTIDGPGVLFTLEFEAQPANGGKETDVEIVFSDLRTGVNDTIAHDVESRHVIVVTPIAVEAVTWGALKSLYREGP